VTAVRALDRKLLRDMKRLWAQSLAVALVMASGVATMLIGVGAYTSLYETRATYYDRSQFADVFAFVVRAPNSLAAKIRRLDGVSELETRIVKSALLDVAGFDLPATAAVISVPASGESQLNKLHLRSGRLPDAGSSSQAVVNEKFAAAHHLGAGSGIDIVLNGTRRHLTITGTALSPEYIYAIGPGDMMPDNRRFAVVWMREPALAAAFNLKGAFNSVVLRLLRDADTEDVLQSLDLMLMRYGGEGAYTRKDQISHAFLDAELKQLRTMSRILPPVFLIVTAFLVNMVLSRLVLLEREQIGLLKAIGYTPLEIAAHYAKLILLIGCLGIVIGFAAGTWLSHGLTVLYSRFFNFPYQIFIVSPGLYAISATVAAGAALIGGMRAVLQAAALSPAVAMLPPTPPSYRRAFSGSFQPLRHFSQLTIMVLRNIIRWPLRALLTSLGIALSIGLLVSSLFSNGAVDYMIGVNFDQADRQDASIAFGEPLSSPVLQEAQRLPGVMRAEPFLSTASRLTNGNHTKRVSLLGKPADMDVSRVLNLALQPVEMPRSGLVLSEALAKDLQVRTDDTVHVELLGRHHKGADIRVAEIIQSYFGMAAFMHIDTLSNLLGEGPRVSGVHLLLDPAKKEAFFAKVKRQPALSALALQRVSLAMFRQTVVENIHIQIAVYASLASIIAFGVVYNSARIQFSERARELASLRVLGFTDYEVSRVLLLEFALLTLAAIPVGWLTGYGLTYILTQGFQSDLYRVPLIIERSTYAYSALIVIAAVTVSALVVRRRVSRLDLVSVLKTRD
jgi:putative ABC transport system permease protein